jgi:hypothetical protein
MFKKALAYTSGLAAAFVAFTSTVGAQVTPNATPLTSDDMATIFNGATSSMTTVVMEYLPILLGVGITVWALRWAIGRALGYLRGL